MGELFSDFISSKLTFRNPEYQNALITGQWNFKNPQSGRWERKHIPEKISGFRIEDDVLILPRGFWQRLKPFLRKNNIGHYVKQEVVEHIAKKKFKYVIPVALRDYQKDAVSAAIKGNSGIIQAPCGSGKTQILTEIARRLNQWTLILVHTEDLMDQMQSRLSQSFGMKIGTIKQKTVDIRPITVASVQTLARRELTPEFLRRWGCVMLDESHHMPAESFTKVVSQFPARYRFGTTATDQRNDRLEGLMFATIGYRLYGISYETLYKQGYLVRPVVRVIETDFEYRMRNKNQYHKLLTALITDKKRNAMIVRNLLLKPEAHHLILSSRIEHLKILHDALIAADPSLADVSSLLIGEMKSPERKKVLFDMMDGNMNYIFATQLADEGLDLPILDTLHLVFPTRAENKVQQQIGRIQRPYPDKIEVPTCYDYEDIGSPTLERQSYSRRQVYKNIGAKVKWQKKERPQELSALLSRT